MGVTTTPVDRGSAPGDGLGDIAYDGTGIINTNISNLDAAVEALQSENWAVQNTSSTLSLGDQIVVTAQSGVQTQTLPAAGAPSATDYNHIYIINNDTNGNNVTIDPNGTDNMIVDGVLNGAGTNYSLSPSYMALLVQTTTAQWSLAVIPIAALSVSGLSDTTVSSATTGDVLYYNGSAWINESREDADIMERDVPAAETTPYLKHETRAARSSGTETITCIDDPSIYLPVSGNNVTIHLDTPALSLPERGLADVGLRGLVVVKATTTISGLTVTTDAGTKLATFPKGVPPASANEYATLAWHYFDDGATDFMWAEWVNDV
jgi:hypothetical protein